MYDTLAYPMGAYRKNARLCAAPGSVPPVGCGGGPLARQADGALDHSPDFYGWTPRETCFKMPIRTIRASFRVSMRPVRREVEMTMTNVATLK